MLNRTTAPEFKAIDHIALLRPGHLAFSNGCNLYYFNSGDQDLVRVEWIFNNLRFNPAKPLLNMAVNTMLTEGTKTATAAQIADDVDFYGAFLQVDYGYDNSQLTLFTLNRHLEKTLLVIKNILANSIFPEKELEVFIRNQQQKLQVGLQKNDVIARRLFNKALNGNTIYGYAAEAADYLQIKRADVAAHFSQMYQPANCTIIAAGKIDEQIVNQITNLFDHDWHNTAVAADVSQPDITPAIERFYFAEKPEALQSAIRVGTRAVTRSHPDFPALQVLNTVLGGYFGSRLMTNIREDKGYTYGIGSGLASHKHAGALFIATEVGADVCKAALTEIEKEINILKAELITAAELSLVRNYMLGSLLGSLENVFSHADKFKNLYFSGLGYDYYDYYTNVIKTVSSQQLLEMANKYLNFDDFYKVIAGKY